MFTQPLVLEWNSGLKKKEEEGNAHLKLINCHNLILKIGILHLILFMLCFMFQFYCICMFVCVLSMFGRV